VVAALVDHFGHEDLEGAPFQVALGAYEYRSYRTRRRGQRLAP
jgi:hypothetical protein